MESIIFVCKKKNNGDAWSCSATVTAASRSRRGLLERVAFGQALHLGDIVKFARPNRTACLQARISRLPFAVDAMLNREIKIHVYSIRQTANVSGEFLRIENKQLKKVQNDSCGQNYHKTTYFCVETINGKRKTRGKLGHVVQIHVCRLA